jgi:hypothetical protein
MLYSASWRKPAVVVGLVAAGTLLATALPESLPLVGQAAFPGGVLALLAAAIRRFSEPAPPRRVAGQPTSQASSLTRSVVPAASLIVAPSTGSAAAVGGGRDGA